MPIPEVLNVLVIFSGGRFEVAARRILRGIFVKIFLLLMSLLPGVAWAGLTSNEVVQKVECRLLNDGVVLKEKEAYMMNIVIDQEYGKFIQIQFGDESTLIQYQLLIENDPEASVPGSMIFLQNLKVGERESSQEFSAQQVNWVRTTNEGYMVQCNLPEPIQ
nr:hypothetical protein CKG001_07820 [Bdellovibrio sp. CKG001]